MDLMNAPPSLVMDYLPLVIFIGLSIVIGSRFWSRLSLSPTRAPMPRSCRLMNAGSTRLTMPA